MYFFASIKKNHVLNLKKKLYYNASIIFFSTQGDYLFILFYVDYYFFIIIFSTQGDPPATAIVGRNGPHGAPSLHASPPPSPATPRPSTTVVALARNRVRGQLILRHSSIRYDPLTHLCPPLRFRN